MILVIGGAFQGKLEYAKNLRQAEGITVADGRGDSFEMALECGIVNYYHEYVRRLLAAGLHWEKFLEDLSERNPDVIVVTCEVGSGIVPADAFDREWREAAGRAASAAAEKSEAVYRLVCGIGTRIK